MRQSVENFLCLPCVAFPHKFGQRLSVLCEAIPPLQGISVNSAPLVAQKMHQSVEKFLCLPWILCETKSLRIPCSLREI